MYTNNNSESGTRKLKVAMRAMACCRGRTVVPCHPVSPRNHGATRGFTLIELLVVISIIALLISLLLPALAEARKDAESVVCSANLHSIGQALQEYADEWQGAIAGSPATSGSFFWSNIDTGAHSPYSDYDYPHLCAEYDWMTPLADEMNHPFICANTADLQAANKTDRLARFNFLRDDPAFICPSNHFLAIPYASSSLQPPVGPMLSYCAAGLFLLDPIAAANYTCTFPYVHVPNSYSPYMNNVGQPSQKCFAADGAAFSTTAQAPEVDLTVTESIDGSAFADEGAFSWYSDSWNRDFAPGNSSGSFKRSTGGVDAREYAYRHGPGLGVYDMNMLFFDGHVALKSDLDSANPIYWCPPGTVIPNTEPTPDVEKKYMGGAASYTVPQ
ncbi:MAG: type II secretion system protein [Phycisphaerae bacterium]